MTKVKDILDLLWTEQTSVYVDPEKDNYQSANFIDVFNKDAVTDYLDYTVAGIDVYNDGTVIINLENKE